MQRRSVIFIFGFLLISVFFINFVLADNNNSTLSKICNDTDGGIIYNIRGITSGVNYYNQSTLMSFVDKCFNATLNINGSEIFTDNWLLEGYCNGSYVFTTDYLCPYDCVDGVCVDAFPINKTCTDSDGGKEYYEQGVTIGFHNGIFEWEFTDECFTTGEEENWLLEGYCNDDGEAYTTDYLCPYGCEDGECIEEEPPNPECYDSDGLNYFNKGKVTGLHNGNPSWTYKDSCSEDYVVEGYCNSRGAYTLDYLCPYGCENGACLTGNNSINLTGNHTGILENSFVKQNWWIFVLAGLILLILIIILVVVGKKKR